MAFKGIAALVAIVTTLISGAWVFGRFLIQEYRTKTELCLTLYTQYFSKEMMEDRRDGWFLLNELNGKRPVLMSTLWSSGSVSQRFSRIYRVMAFFHSIYVLDSMKRLDRRLARKLFGYQYSHWRKQLSPLIEDTLHYDQDRPEVLDAFLDDNLLWLTKSTRIFNPATGVPPESVTESGNF